MSARLLRVDDRIVDDSLIDVTASSADRKVKNDERGTLLREKVKEEARKPLYLLRYE